MLKDDYYVTPIGSITSFMKAFTEDEKINWEDKIILDPCAGGRVNSISEPMAYPKVLSPLCKNKIETLDIRQDSPAGIAFDYLRFKPLLKYDVIITHPPFTLALEIAKKAMSEVKLNGYVIMLLRANLLGEKSKHDFWNTFVPKYCYMHSLKMSFMFSKGRDVLDYMHCVWQVGVACHHTKLKVIK